LASLPHPFSLHVPAILSSQLLCISQYPLRLWIYSILHYFLFFKYPPLGPAHKSSAVFSFRRSLTNSRQNL
jgi:hypothetical protein